MVFSILILLLITILMGGFLTYVFKLFFAGRISGNGAKLLTLFGVLIITLIFVFCMYIKKTMF